MGNVTVAAAGIQGPRGNTILTATRSPLASDGVDGDYFVDNTTPSAKVLYGPKAGGVWGSGVPIGGAVGALLAANNLGDVANAATARGNLGLGGAATLNVGTSSSTVAAGNDSRITGALQAGSNLSDLGSATTARTNLGLGTAATQATAAFDAAGAASTAEAAAIADAATKYLPLQPWVFNVQATAYGAKGDGQLVSDAAMSSGSAVVTSASGKFGNVVAGMPVMVCHAGPTGVTTLVTTAASKQSSTQITLNATNASGGNLTGAIVLWGTDDTAAIQSAINAAVAYAQAHGGAATVLIPAAVNQFYVIAGGLSTASSGNAQLTIPVVATTGNKLVLTFQGSADGAAVQHWQQIPPQMSGSTLVSFGVFANPTAQNTSISNNGNAALLGGPSQPAGYGISPGVFSNVEVVVRQLSLRTTHSAYGLGYTAMDFSGLANAALYDVGYGSLGTVGNADFGNPSVFGTGLSIGLLMPSSGNNDLCIMSNVTCFGGYTYAAFVTEHTDLYGVRLLYCWAGLCPVGLYYGSVGSTHAIRGFVSVEACHYHLYLIGPGSGGIGIFLHLVLDTEGSVLFGDNDSGTASASAKGTVVLTGEVTFPISLDHPIGFDLVNDQLSFPTAAASSSYTVQPWDEVIEASGTITVTLPSAATRTKRVVVVNTGTGTVTVQVAGGQLISGAASKTLTTQWAHAEYTPSASGSSWNQIA